MLSAALRACYQPGNVPVTLVIEEGMFSATTPRLKPRSRSCAALIRA